MVEEQGTEETLQENLESPPVVETDSQEEVTLTEEQKEELFIQQETEKIADKNDPPGVQKRINQAVRKWHVEERARAKAEKEGTETKAVLEEMRKHNEKLYSAIQKQTAAIETSVEAQSEKTQQDASKQELNTIQQQINILKGERIKAIEEMNGPRFAAIDDQLENLKEQLSAKKQEVAQKKPQKQDSNEKYEYGVIETWKSDTPWFEPLSNGEPNPEFNMNMKIVAMEYDKKLIESGRWNNIPIEQRLEEVKKHTEQKFAYKPKQHGIGKIPSVESGKDLPPSKKDNVIQLTDMESNVVRKMFPNMPFSEASKAYQEQKQFINGGK
jgi:hypothetical protein